MKHAVGTAPRRIAGKKTACPRKMTARERQALARQLYEIHCQIFRGVSFADFVAHVVEPPAERTAIQLYFGPGGGLAGYCAFHRFRRRVQGRRVLVLRAEAGLRPEYRGRGTTYWFGMTQALWEKLRHPFTPVYYLGTLVHTSSYHLFCKFFPRVYPHPEHGIPPEARAAALEIAASFPDPPASPEDPLVRDVGWITIETEQEKALNARSGLPDTAYFLERNPGYARGHGLVTLVPITFANVTGAIFCRLAEAVRLALKRQEPSL